MPDTLRNYTTPHGTLTLEAQLDAQGGSIVLSIDGKPIGSVVLDIEEFLIGKREPEAIYYVGALKNWIVGRQSPRDWHGPRPIGLVALGWQEALKVADE